MAILLTGASGFVGSRLIDVIDGDLIPVVRRASNLEGEVLKTIDGATNWAGVLERVDVIIHCAARVHVMNDDVQVPLAAFRAVNVEGAENLARQAARAGVKRFILLSSIKVNGECSLENAPFSEQDEANPQDPYAISKYEAEESLKEICAETGMEFVIIRPPLVYGAKVKANFRSMLKWLSFGVPLPLGAIKHNKRSLVYVDNLVDLIKVCIEHPAAANQTFLVSDDEDISTEELLRRNSRALGKKLHLFPVPEGLFNLVGKLVGRGDIGRRLADSLQVDISHTKMTLNWKPPHSLEYGLKETSDWFKNFKP